MKTVLEKAGKAVAYLRHHAPAWRPSTPFWGGVTGAANMAFRWPPARAAWTCSIWQQRFPPVFLRKTPVIFFSPFSEQWLVPKAQRGDGGAAGRCCDSDAAVPLLPLPSRPAVGGQFLKSCLKKVLSRPCSFQTLAKINRFMAQRFV